MTKTLSITPLRTDIFRQGENLVEFILRSVPASSWHEGVILTITTKIVSLAENRVETASAIDKKSLIRREADHYLGEIGHGVSLTIKHGLMLPAAGIDESNSENGDYILYPKNPLQSAQNIHHALKDKLGLKKLGVILTDSRSNPLRLGVTGVALALAGFHPLKSMIGEKDIFGRPLKMTKINIADSLAASAVLMMGEGAERCPMALISGVEVEFTDSPNYDEWLVSIDDDMYLPLYQHLLK